MFAYYYFLNLRKLQVAQKLQKDILSVLQWTLLWPVIVDKAIVQLNKIKSLHCNENPLEQKQRSLNIPGRLHQSTAHLPQELKSAEILEI